MALAFAKVVEALKGGDAIMVSHPSPMRATDEKTYGLLRLGKNVGARNFAKLKDKIAPAGDGLFPEESSQTFVWKGDDASN